MKNFDFKTNIIAHLIALLIFFAISVMYYSPLIFQSKTLRLHDVEQGIGGGHEAAEFRKATGQEALWTNSMFGGMPTYLINTRWGDTLMWQVVKVLSVGLPSPANLTLISMMCCYLLLIVTGTRSWIAVCGAIAFGMSSFLLISIGAGHIWKVRAIAFAPLVIAGCYLLFEKNNRLWGFILSAVGLSLELWSNHLQITYYLMMLLLIYGGSIVYFAIKEKTHQRLLTNIGIVLLAVALAVATNVDRLWSTYEYGKYSTRGKTELTSATARSGLDRDYVFRWSSGVGESFTLLIPYFYGGASSEALDEDSQVADALSRQGRRQIRQTIDNMPTYWGDQPFTAGPVYAGAIVCFLFVLGILVLDCRLKSWLISAVIFSLMLAWGSNFSSFNYLMYELFPAYNKFRSVSMAITIALICMPFLGALGLEKLLSTGLNQKTQKQLLTAFGITAGLCLLFALFAGMFSYKGAVDGQLQLPEWLVSAIRADRQALLRGDALRSFVLITASALIIYMMVKVKGPVKTTLGAVLLILLMVFDHFTVDRRYLNGSHFKKNANRSFFVANDADKKIKEDKGSYRVLNLLNPWNEARTSYHHQSVGGYHGAKPKRMQELIDYCLGSQVGEVVSILRSQSTDFTTLNAVNMLNTKYFAFGEEATNVISNDNAFGNAWLVSSVQQVNNADEEIASTCGMESKNAVMSAIIDVSKFTINHDTYHNDGTIVLTNYQPNRLTYEANIVADQALAVFSEMYYAKGWVAEIDGQQVDILRANYILRALEIPQGKHTITFSFKPQVYYIGSKVATASSVLLLLIVLTGIGMSVGKLMKWYR